MTCEICGPLDRHDGEHCETCHAVHRGLWVEVLEDTSRGPIVTIARRVLAQLDAERPFA